MMLLEIEATLGVQALGLAFDTFSNATIHLHQDLAGRDRLLEIKLHTPSLICTSPYAPNRDSLRDCGL